MSESLFDNAIPVPFCGCWIWLGGIVGGGYGEVRDNGKTRRAHRFL